MVIFFAGLILMTLEVDTIINTVHGSKFFLIFGGTGVLIFIVLMAVFKIKTPSLFYESNRRLSIYLSLFIGLILMVPAIAVFINKNFTTGSTEYKKFYVTSKTIVGSRQTDPIIHCIVEGKEERFDPKKPEWIKIVAGDSLELCLNKGFFGYYYVAKFISLEKSKTQK